MLAIYGALFWAVGAFTAAVSQAASSFGFGILMLLFWQFTGLLADKIPVYSIQYPELQFVTVVASLPLNVYMAGYGVWKKHYSIPLIAMMATVIPSMALLGARIMLTMDMHILKRILGAFFLFFSLVRLGSDGFEEFKLRKKDVQQAPAVVPGVSGCMSRRGKTWEYVGWFFASVCSGLLIGLFGAGGPPFMVYLTMVDTHPTVFRTCLGVANVVSAGRSILMILTPGVVHWKEHAILYLSCIVACVVGAHVGNKLHTKINRQTFLRIIMVLLLVCSVTMLVDIRSATVSGRIGLIVVCAILAASFASVLLLAIRRSNKSTTSFNELEEEHHTHSDDENPHAPTRPAQIMNEPQTPPTSNSHRYGDRSAVDPWSKEMMQMDKLDLPADDGRGSSGLPLLSPANGHNNRKSREDSSGSEVTPNENESERQTSQNGSSLHRALSRFSLS